MKNTHQPAMKLLRILEMVLWTASCCAVFYSIFYVGDALVSQTRLVQAFERVRTLETNPTLASNSMPAASTGAKPAPISTNGAEPLGRLVIPRVGLSAMVLEGDGSRTLRVGLGHIPGTSDPGQPGNVAIAGHRDTFFRPLRSVARGDEIVFQTPSHDYHYRVRSIEIVDPADVAVLDSHRKNELTLVTCYPFSYIGAASKRFIVRAILASRESASEEPVKTTGG